MRIANSQLWKENVWISRIDWLSTRSVQWDKSEQLLNYRQCQLMKPHSRGVRLKLNSLATATFSGWLCPPSRKEVWYRLVLLTETFDDCHGYTSTIINLNTAKRAVQIKKVARVYLIFVQASHSLRFTKNICTACLQKMWSTGERLEKFSVLKLLLNLISLERWTFQ